MVKASTLTTSDILFLIVERAINFRHVHPSLLHLQWLLWEEPSRILEQMAQRLKGGDASHIGGLLSARAALSDELREAWPRYYCPLQLVVDLRRLINEQRLQLRPDNGLTLGPTAFDLRSRLGRVPGSCAYLGDILCNIVTPRQIPAWLQQYRHQP